jgi:hypothetical protein
MDPVDKQTVAGACMHKVAIARMLQSEKLRRPASLYGIAISKR